MAATVCLHSLDEWQQQCIADRLNHLVTSQNGFAVVLESCRGPDAEAVLGCAEDGDKDYGKHGVDEEDQEHYVGQLRQRRQHGLQDHPVENNWSLSECLKSACVCVYIYIYIYICRIEAIVFKACCGSDDGMVSRTSLLNVLCVKESVGK